MQACWKKQLWVQNSRKKIWNEFNKAQRSYCSSHQGQSEYRWKGFESSDTFPSFVLIWWTEKVQNGSTVQCKEANKSKNAKKESRPKWLWHKSISFNACHRLTNQKIIPSSTNSMCLVFVNCAWCVWHICWQKGRNNTTGGVWRVISNKRQLTRHVGPTTGYKPFSSNAPKSRKPEWPKLCNILRLAA